MIPFDGLKTFSSTKWADREHMGDDITGWLRSHAEIEVVDREVRQSSDSEFHCLTIVLFWKFREPCEVCRGEHGGGVLHHTHLPDGTLGHRLPR